MSFKHYVTQRMMSCSSGNLYLFDLDYFKSVNDIYGHITGDALLKMFSGMLKETFSADAIIGRLGGDEFAVFECKPIHKELTIQKITQMQEGFESAAQATLTQGIASFSVGIVSQTGEQDLYDDVFANSDKALYHAKN